MSAEIWKSGVGIFVTIFFAIWLVYAAIFSFHAAKGFLNDKEANFPFCCSDGEEVLLNLALAALLGLFAGFVWPISVPGLLIFAVLYALRGAVRFKKVYKAHQHDSKTGQVIGENHV